MPRQTIVRLVLIADHDVNVRRFVDATLSPLGYVVRHARDGSDALSILVETSASRSPVSVLLLALNMPYFPGLSVLLAMRSAGLDIPTVAITDHDDPTIAARAHRFGARLVLRKPLEPSSLRAAADGAGGVRVLS